MESRIERKEEKEKKENMLQNEKKNRI